jgi:hypothetical protein
MTTAARRRTQWCLGVELFPIRDPHQYHLDALVSTGRPVPQFRSGFAQTRRRPQKVSPAAAILAALASLGEGIDRPKWEL